MRTFPAVLATAIAVALAGCTTATDAPEVESRDMPQGAAGSAQASSAPRGHAARNPGLLAALFVERRQASCRRRSGKARGVLRL